MPGRHGRAPAPRAGPAPRTTRCARPASWSGGPPSSPAAGPAPTPTATNHRTHVTFPDPATGACPTDTVPIPQLRITLSYHTPPGRSYAIDSFPDQQRKAVTDHFDFENLMPESLMARMAVDCINTGRTC